MMDFSSKEYDNPFNEDVDNFFDPLFLKSLKLICSKFKYNQAGPPLLNLPSFTSLENLCLQGSPLNYAYICLPDNFNSTVPNLTFLRFERIHVTFRRHLSLQKLRNLTFHKANSYIRGSDIKLGDLPSLQEIYITETRLSEFPRLKHLKSLFSLNMIQNSLTVCPLSLLPESLVILDISSNRITGIVRQLSDAHRQDIQNRAAAGLRYHTPSASTIHSVSSLPESESEPSSLSDSVFLPNFENLIVKDNQIQEIQFLPPSLKRLDLSSNLNLASFPMSLPNLQFLDLTLTAINKLPQNFNEQLPRLIRLDYHKSSHNIHPQIGSIDNIKSSNLNVLNIKQLHASFPKFFGNLLPNLYRLEINLIRSDPDKTDNENSETTTTLTSPTIVSDSLQVLRIRNYLGKKISTKNANLDIPTSTSTSTSDGTFQLFIHAPNLKYLSISRSASLSSLENIFLPKVKTFICTGGAISTVSRDFFKTHLPTAEIVWLNSQNLVHLENLSSNSILELSLKCNKIFHIIATFGILFPKIRTLNLYRNAIIHWSQFHSKTLEFLDLSHNKLISISPDAFESLPNLKSLNLRGNSLRVFPELANPHVSLHYLNLDNNQVKKFMHIDYEFLLNELVPVAFRDTTTPLKLDGTITIRKALRSTFPFLSSFSFRQNVLTFKE